jgi:hypothetical protein
VLSAGKLINWLVTLAAVVTEVAPVKRELVAYSIVYPVSPLLSVQLSVICLVPHEAEGVAERIGVFKTIVKVEEFELLLSFDSVTVPPSST